MQIVIKINGQCIAGGVSWFLQELTNGTMNFNEDNLLIENTIKHTLIMACAYGDYPLAEFDKGRTLFVVRPEIALCSGLPFLTPACQKLVLLIAQKWCEAKNQFIAEEELNLLKDIHIELLW